MLSFVQILDNLVELGPFMETITPHENRAFDIIFSLSTFGVILMLLFI